MTEVCKDWDDFTRDKAEQNTLWLVELSNGETVIQDDGRPGVYPHSAWERLGHYCHDNDLHITFMKLKFRSHVEDLERNCDGYFFCKSILGGFGMKKSIDYYLTGCLKYGILKVTKWRVPELVSQSMEERDVDNTGICLIKRKDV